MPVEWFAGVPPMLTRWLVGWGVLAVLLGYLVVLETLFPRQNGPRPSWRSRGKAAVFWALYIVIVDLVMAGSTVLYAGLGIRPLFPSLEPGFLPRPVAVVVAATAAVMIGDFVYYWCHRFQHRFLWRFHAVHHSVREMSAVTAYHHVTEPLMRLALYIVPVSLLTRDPYALPVIGMLLGLHGHYLHSTTRLNFGRLGSLIQDNRFHRIHHSIHPEHHDRNFAVITTLWDRLFGTAYFPRDEEWPDTGVAEMPEPASLRDFVLAPFMWGRTAANRPPRLGERLDAGRAARSAAGTRGA